MADEFRVYPRGFLGDFTNKHIAYRNDPSAETVELVRNAGTLPARYKMLGEPNQHLDELYLELLSAPSNMERFAWREGLLKIALKAFGTDSVHTWIKAQAASAYCGKYHKNFIMDCMRFANGGDREQAISSWSMLITDDDMDTGGKMPSRADGFTFNGVVLEKARIMDLIKAWCSQPGGYSDLAISLNILFGRYDGLY